MLFFESLVNEAVGWCIRFHDTSDLDSDTLLGLAIPMLGSKVEIN